MVVTLHTPKMGYAKGFLTMFVKKIKNRSGRTSVVVGLKDKGKFKRLATMGVSSDEDELSALVGRGNEWIADHMERTNPTIDFDGEKEKRRREDAAMVDDIFGRIENVQLNGCELILDRVFDLVGFNQIKDKVFRQLVCSRLSFPASKAATVE